jgi:hypothetical protein
MLVIAEVALDQFSRQAHDGFVTRMRVHLRNFFSEQCNALGDEKIGRLIEFGIQRAGEHGFETERDVCKYIDLMCIFGDRFDRDDRLSWARHILESRYPPDPTDRMQYLHATALDALREFEGRERGVSA